MCMPNGARGPTNEAAIEPGGARVRRPASRRVPCGRRLLPPTPPPSPTHTRTHSRPSAPEPKAISLPSSPLPYKPLPSPAPPALPWPAAPAPPAAPRGLAPGRPLPGAAWRPAPAPPPQCPAMCTNSSAAQHGSGLGACQRPRRAEEHAVPYGIRSGHTPHKAAQTTEECNNHFPATAMRGRVSCHAE